MSLSIQADAACPKGISEPLPRQLFLKAGDKVRASIKLKGRQMARPEIAIKVMEEFFELVKENGVIEKPANLEGRSISMIIASNVKK